MKAQRKNTPSLERPVANLTVKPSILIVCEGKNTEPSYFKQFRVSSAEIKYVGEGYNTVSLVKRTIELSKQYKYDRVWCVFDKDDFNDNDFNTAIKMAEENAFGVAYSNQAFEYWLILHFNDHQGGKMHRDKYTKEIKKHIKPFKASYDGNSSKKVSEEFFELLDGIDSKTNQKRVNLAIIRAERNYIKLKHLSPAKAESSTTVYMLVRELLKYV